MLEVHDLAARRGVARLFEGVAFVVRQGEVLVVTGANGAGKTTLLRILAGMSSPSAGVLKWNGHACRPFDERLRAAVAFAGHAPALKDELSAAENLASLAALAGERPTQEALDEALASVSLANRRDLPARVLSQGQRRRIGLARLTLAQRPLWILDEPTTALDSAGSALMSALIGAHLERGGAAVVATHQALALPATRVAALTLG